MASTYVNDLRLNEMATGDGSGTWGTTTNSNLELIGEALGYGTEGITTNADTHTSTIADGATDPVRAMYVKYTGTLDSACTITIAPNTINRMQFIENATSGSQNIIISQGSGANITIPAGDTKAVYLDGAGSGAAVVDAFASLNVVDLKVQDDLTVTDDLTVNGDIDLAGSIDVDGTANLDAVDIDGAVQIDSTVTVGADDTGYDVKFFGDTASAYMLWDTSADDLVLAGAAGIDLAGDLDVDGTANLDVVDIDGAVDMASTLTLAGNADFNGDLDVDGTTNLDAVDIDGAVQLDSTLTVGVDGTGHDVKFFGDTASAYMLWDQSTDDLILGGASRLGVGTTTPGAPLNVKSTADGTLQRFSRSGVCDWDVSIGNTPVIAGGSSGDLEIIPQNTNMGFTVGRTSAALNGRFRDGVLTLGSGIKFNSDTAAANMLDDYEEGTWTPTIASDAAPSAYNYATGYYTKIGRVVHLTGQLRVSDMGSMTGATINAGGFPFTVANLTNYDPRGVVGLVSAATAKSDIFCRGVANSTYARVEQDNGATTSDRNMNANAFDTDTVFFIDLTFVIA